VKRDSFDFLARMLRRTTGVAIVDSQSYMIESRLAPIVRRHALPGIDELAWMVRSSADGKIAMDVIEAMLAGHAFFFRDWAPFEALAGAVLPGLAAQRGNSEEKRIRIWSAGCGGGEEAYSIAMVLAGAADALAGVKVELVATDVSQAALAKAAAGLYTTTEIQRGLPVRLLVEHFRPEESGWRIAPPLRAMVELRRHNLIESYRQLGTFDVVFCRDVLSMFDAETRGETLRRIADLMPDDGVLFLGAAETAAGAADMFLPVPGGAGIFRRAARVQPARRAAL
jgi:chemotaxis protein methyltransferase CheR